MYPYKMVSNFMRCSNNYVSSKGQKSYARNLFFNLVRCVPADIMKQLLYKNRVNVRETLFTIECVLFYTLVLQYLPMRWFRKTRYLWAWMGMEYYTKHASDLIYN